jgi:hypothetical protein
MKPNKKKTKKQRREDNRDNLSRLREKLKKKGVHSTVFYSLPEEMKQAKAVLPKIMTDPFSPSRKLQQLERCKGTRLALPTSPQQSGQLELTEEDDGHTASTGK